MSRRALCICTDRSADELRRRARREASPAASVRLYAIANALDGMSRAEAARLAGMERQALCDAAMRYNADALGTATEMKAQRNYAGHRLSPWLGHLMVLRQETARPLLTPGEIMQLPPVDELVLVSGLHPIRAKKVRFFEDRQLKARVLAPPTPKIADRVSAARTGDDWTMMPTPSSGGNESPSGQIDDPADDADPANSGIRREPELSEHEAVEVERPAPVKEFDFEDEYGDEDDAAIKAQVLRPQFGNVARQASLDPDDGIRL